MTKQDTSKKIFEELTKERVEEITKDLKEIPSYLASESHVLTESERAVMTQQASKKFEELFDILKLDYKNDENLKSTPYRVASMFVNELMIGRYTKPPRIEAFPATYYKGELPLKESYENFIHDQLTEDQWSYDEDKNVFFTQLDQIELALDSIEKKFDKDFAKGHLSNELLSEAWKLLEDKYALIQKYFPTSLENTKHNMVVKSVDINSLCSHHLISFVTTDDDSSKCLIAYIPTLGSPKALLGISKLQRIADYFGRRPQLQETLNWQIRTYVALILRSPHVMVSMHNIVHYCEKTRGVESHCGSTSGMEVGGLFKDPTYINLAITLAKK